MGNGRLKGSQFVGEGSSRSPEGEEEGDVFSDGSWDGRGRITGRTGLLDRCQLAKECRREGETYDGGVETSTGEAGSSN